MKAESCRRRLKERDGPGSDCSLEAGLSVPPFRPSLRNSPGYLGLIEFGLTMNFTTLLGSLKVAQKDFVALSKRKKKVFR